MEWLGEKIKDLIKENNISIVKLAEKAGVSRQTVNDWIGGQVPKGNHLIKLCKIFNINPDFLFSKGFDESISVPVHRTRSNAKVNAKMQQDALGLAKEYDLLFRNDADSGILPVMRGQNRTNQTAKKVAKELRTRAEIIKDCPPGYEHVFTLMENLGIKIIFRNFPEKIKAYAFYTKIHGHRVVFVNTGTNVLDLIFPLLHEAVHAVRDEYRVNDGFDEDEELFCDMVANYIQFPDEYVRMIYDVIKDLDTGIQVNKLKTFGSKYRHALYGLAKRIKDIDPNFNLNVGGPNTNLKKEFPTIGEILYKNNEPREYVDTVAGLSPLFINTILYQIDGLTNRKLAEILGIESLMDAKAVKDELVRLKKADS
ncbi:MAG: ImmA/IrrE family metallo-endopeptidase [Desulfobacula sp.]|nr:ImmA/IrrE family metallo-endopeptidase [Desulfobacula sp.]